MGCPCSAPGGGTGLRGPQGVGGQGRLPRVLRGGCEGVAEAVPLLPGAGGPRSCTVPSRAPPGTVPSHAPCGTVPNPAPRGDCPCTAWLGGSGWDPSAAWAALGQGQRWCVLGSVTSVWQDVPGARCSPCTAAAGLGAAGGFALPAGLVLGASLCLRSLHPFREMRLSSYRGWGGRQAALAEGPHPGLGRPPQCDGTGVSWCVRPPALRVQIP